MPRVPADFSKAAKQKSPNGGDSGRGVEEHWRVLAEENAADFLNHSFHNCFMDISESCLTVLRLVQDAPRLMTYLCSKILSAVKSCHSEKCRCASSLKCQQQSILGDSRC